MSTEGKGCSQNTRHKGSVTCHKCHVTHGRLFVTINNLFYFSSTTTYTDSSMAKGSQLTQLKSALSQAGLSRQTQQSKKKKREKSRDGTKNKRAEKLQEIHDRLNPFDVKVTKLKQDVGGRKLKGLTGKPSASKQAGLEQVRGSVLVQDDTAHRDGAAQTTAVTGTPIQRSCRRNSGSTVW